jgi:hypothetical protein
MGQNGRARRRPDLAALPGFGGGTQEAYGRLLKLMEKSDGTRGELEVARRPVAPR